MPKKKKLNVQDIGRKGGKTTLKKHGKDHYKKIARARWAKQKAAQEESKEKK